MSLPPPPVKNGLKLLETEQGVFDTIVREGLDRTNTMRVYKLDLDTLLPLLEEFRQDGHLSTVLPPSTGILGYKEQCLVGIDLTGGKVIHCQIEGRNGQVLALGSPALHLLSGLGTREWRLDVRQDVLLPEPTASSPQQPLLNWELSPVQQSSPAWKVPQGSSFPIPQRTAYVSQESLYALSRQHRRVFVLVDGVRSVEKITELLFPTTHDVQAVLDVLRALEAIGIITQRR